MNNGTIENILQFIENKGLIDSSRPPRIGEPFYEEWMQEVVNKLSLKIGDKIKITYQYDKQNELTLTGILINDMDWNADWIKLLTEGKKLWKSRKNEKEIHLSNVVKIEKLEEAAPDFDIKTVNPYYSSPEEIKANIKEYNKKINNTISPETIKQIQSSCPDCDIQNNVFLGIEFSIYNPFCNIEIESADVKIVTASNSNDIAPQYKIGHIYPNRNYYSIHGVVKKENCVIVPFKDKEALNDVSYILCIWNLKVGNRNFKVVTAYYPTFKTEDGNIYYIEERITLLDVYAESLYKRNVFSGDIYTEFSFVGTTTDNENINIINGDISEERKLDLVMQLAGGDLSEAIKNICEKEHPYKEIFVKEINVYGTNDFIPRYHHKEYMERKKAKIDFSKFL